MSVSRTYEFQTPHPAELVVEVDQGTVRVAAADTAETRVRVAGADARETTVEQTDGRIEVTAPPRRSGFLSGAPLPLEVEIELPTGSDAAIRTGSADVTVEGAVRRLQVRTGSGGVRVERLTGPGQVETGSGDVRVGHAAGDLQVKTGSGDTEVTHAAGALAVSAGSGDVVLDAVEGPVMVKTGTGDLLIRAVHADVSMTTGSGDLAIGSAHRGRLQARAASGDVRIGIPPGVPVWTDLSTVTGSIRSEVRGTGAPAEGADHVELRATSVSGDIMLVEA
ncbi:DUF4097 family beta strand repeat-containing protein [Nocardioides pantholopis]|uniref:DUF4097 family beta strand repeat-containing protein n=1 Tax=Nocardioides pantholopis TaxID=2483798 RepID=UPI000F093B18|nr:DUF4097 family beta strand repeat-containing protein [Nocardioides pantholopis]